MLYNFHSNHFDYSTVPVSQKYTTEQNTVYRDAVKKHSVALKTSDANTEYSHLACVSVEKGARDGNMDILNAFLPALPFDDGLWRDLQQTVARGHFEAFCRIAQHMRGQKDLIKGLEAAVYFGKQDFIDAIAPYCQELNDSLGMKRVVSAAIEGKQYAVAQQFMPFAYTGRGLMGELLTALLNKKFGEAEVWYPYSSVKLVRKHILYQPKDKDTVAALEWLEDRANCELAEKIHKKVKSTHSATRMRKI